MRVGLLRGWFRGEVARGASMAANGDDATSGAPISDLLGLADLVGAASSAHDPATDVAPRHRWTSSRREVVEMLWGPGFTGPGGPEEVRSLVKALGLSPAATLLLLGGGLGGPGEALASQSGVWVSAYEADRDLVDMAVARLRGTPLEKRACMGLWTPASPSLRPRSANHALALEPLRGVPIEPVLAEIANALKRGGQFVMTDLVADGPLDPADEMVDRWCRLEDRAAVLPTEADLTFALCCLGLDVRITEDISARHMHQTLAGWRQAVDTLHKQRPAPAIARALVQEAERWLLRLRLMRGRTIRLVRWHAISTG